jgi:serine/threonine protein kinase
MRQEVAAARATLANTTTADHPNLRRFQQEAQAVAALNHPNSLAIHDFGEHEGSPYIVTEFLEGETLRDRLRAGAMPVRKAIEFAEQIARGLAAAHEKGIVHRDLKPYNLYLTKDGRIKILDFGLAKLTLPKTSSPKNWAARNFLARGTQVRKSVRNFRKKVRISVTNASGSSIAAKCPPLASSVQCWTL